MDVVNSIEHCSSKADRLKRLFISRSEKLFADKSASNWEGIHKENIWGDMPFFKSLSATYSEIRFFYVRSSRLVNSFDTFSIDILRLSVVSFSMIS